jgi:GNAT superfamily N-acetyltransferase
VGEVRLLTPEDIPAAMRLKDAARWNQTPADWRNVMTLAPDGCFGMDCDGALRATATAVCYGRELAWIGMVLTDPAFRGRGLARGLMEHALEYVRMRGVQWVKLDATDMGHALYERLGFRDECVIERWMKPPGGTRQIDARQTSARSGVFESDPVLDRQAFGADRAELLRLLAGIESTSIVGEGFAMGRPGSNAAYFGPCVAWSAGAARNLLIWFLEKHGDEGVYWDILPANADAMAMAREFGFERVRELMRMRIEVGKNVPALANRDELVFATAGFEYG